MLFNFATILLAAAIGVVFALAGASHGLFCCDYPVMVLIVSGIFTVQILAFIPAYILRTEKFYDLAGSLTYITAVVTSIAAIQNADARSYLLTALILLWTLRLGYYLFQRVLRVGEDSRFAKIRHSFWEFLTAWILQGTWITFSLAAALAAITATKKIALDFFALSGSIIWLIGFLIEAVADWQKSQFRKNPANAGMFIRTGLWSWSRHPNYFGEIVLWIGIAVIAFPILRGWQFVTLLSPVFVAVLLIKVSGVPLLEAAADKKWGATPEYEAYKDNVSTLFPWRKMKSSKLQR